MVKKLPLWKAYPSWEEAEKAWDAGAKEAAVKRPLKKPAQLPSIPGITDDTAAHLKWKTLTYMVKHDKDRVVLKNFLKHPVKYATRLLRSLLQKKSYTRDGDFFLFGIPSVAAFQDLLVQPDTLLVVGFSYCHKPFECPSGRFTKECSHDPEHPVCRQCFIGKAVNALPQTLVVPLFIITIHHIGEEMFSLRHAHPDKQLLFIITACELTLEMGGDLGNMIQAKGIGVRLDGRICNTMKAFELSETGIKPGLTVVLEDTQTRLLDLLRLRSKTIG